MVETPTAFPLQHPTITLIGDGEVLPANSFSRSVEIDLSSEHVKGDLHAVILVTEGGSVPRPSGILYIFDTDPEILLGDTDMDASDHARQIAKFEVGVIDWDMSGTAASILRVGMFHFERGDGLWMCFKTMAPFAADEILQVVPRYR